MARTHVIPGAVTRRTLKALVLTDGAGSPQVRVVPESANVPAPIVSLEPLAADARLRAHLDPVRLFLARVSGLTPGVSYRLEWSGGASRFRTPSEDLPLKIVVASCYYDGYYGDERYRCALDQPHIKDAAFKLLVGDNLYLDTYDRDFRDPWRDVAGLYLRHFWEPGYRDVLSRLPTLTTWDDHEFWNNYPENPFWLGYTQDGRRGPLNEAAQECLRLFQASLNPDPGPGVPHLSYRVDDLPHVSLFVADTRSQREQDATGHEDMMHPRALLALKDWAGKLGRPGVLVLGQPLWMSEGSRMTDLNPPRFRDQYDAIWAALAAAKWDVVVVSGDVHHSRILALELDGGGRVYEYVSSPACHIPAILGGQDSGDVNFPTAAPYSLVPGDPRLVSDPYLFGTDVPFTVGTLVFHPQGGGAVTVDAAFWNLRHDHAWAAPSRQANDGFGKRGIRPREDWCQKPGAFTLKPRP